MIGKRAKEMEGRGGEWRNGKGREGRDGKREVWLFYIAVNCYLQFILPPTLFPYFVPFLSSHYGRPM